LRHKAVPESRSRSLAPPPLATRGFSQHKIFENKVSFTCRERRIADSTRDFAIGGFRPRFCFDNLIQRFAVWAKEQWRIAICHQTPHANFAVMAHRSQFVWESGSPSACTGASITRRGSRAVRPSYSPRSHRERRRVSSGLRRAAGAAAESGSPWRASGCVERSASAGVCMRALAEPPGLAQRRTPTATTLLTTLTTFLTTFLLTTLATVTSLLALILTLTLRHHYLPLGISKGFGGPCPERVRRE
jgi:hypothetical protein